MTPVVRLAIGVVLVLVAVALALWFFVFSDRDAPVDAPPELATVVPTATPEPTLEERLSERLEGTTLSSSDTAVRELVVGLSSRPELVEWLVNEDLIRRFVASVHNIADGKSPRKHLEFLVPSGGFQVREVRDDVTVDARSWARYDTAALVFAELDSDGTATLFAELEPLIDEAHREIAPPSSEFRGVLRTAIDHLLAAPVPAGPVVVEKKVVTYVFADPVFEGLSEAQRQLVRMGPENQELVQAKLVELKVALGL